MENVTRPFVSAIVPVYNDAAHLKLCLEALENQTYPKSNYEVIVVDNASDNGEEIKKVVDQFTQALVAYESFPSSFGARNKGISLAKGNIIAFTDADCIPAINWIESGVNNLLNAQNCGLVAGRIQVFFKNLDKVTPVELYENITAFPQKELIEKQHYAATANIFTWKQVFDRVGMFVPELKSSGDIEWGWRVYSAGYRQVYADDTCVSHPARYSISQLYKRTIRLAGGIYDLYDRKSYSLLKRNVLYAINLLQNLIPPINFVINTFKNPDLKKIQQKLQVSLVMFLVRYVTAGEMIRLKLGGSSTRD
ncbi:glycosyltransferase [Merismopedia glauca]|uniref:4,4'-diaponeurosporenoate glycosyltransferase n=1 Tax=Merismopedia glauca CCAP 1448/3 TaxID=1296344 RepID=A0A2T1BZP9_9CYAN|nr:glycosyltransferase [Merismopedia glauca]PSB01505.1 glycosyl transferase family 2 [Merismopedia glauca CCAP 1448/3]